MYSGIFKRVFAAEAEKAEHSVAVKQNKKLHGDQGKCSNSLWVCYYGLTLLCTTSPLTLYQICGLDT